MKQTKYVKPTARVLGGLSGAEGQCIGNGLVPYGTACTTGTGTASCGSGSTANVTSEGFCFNGHEASNCVTNGSSAFG